MACIQGWHSFEGSIIFEGCVSVYIQGLLLFEDGVNSRAAFI